VGHSDVAPNRKQDPGELFPWAQLAGSGIGLWPSLADQKRSRELLSAAEGEDFAADLRHHGYGVPPDVDWPLPDVITAFQRHFRPSCINGIPDAECAAILRALLAA